MNKNNAQSTLELIAVIMLVAATIFIGGPTIIRGVNAHFKIWDDSVQDSYKDPLKQAPPQNLPTDCVCDPPIGGPGLRCGVSPCAPTEHLETVLCNPVGCGAALGITEQTCVNDPICCTIYYDTALCGEGGAAPDCPLGDRVTQRACGGGINDFSCRTDSQPTGVDGNPTCIPHCIGAYNPNEAAAVGNPTVPVICPGDDTSVVGAPWIQDASGIGIAITILGHDVAVCSHPPSPGPDNKCEAYCLPGYIHVGAGCVPNYCRSSFFVAAITPNGVTDASFTMCEPDLIGSATVIGCGNPGIPGSPCALELYPVAGGPGFSYCQKDFTIPTVIPNASNNQSFTQCEADTLTSTIMSGAGCGNPGVPASACTLQIY